MDTGHTIGELAREVGVNVETVRYYERRGILKQPKRQRGWRHYDEEALRTLRFIRRAQELGFTLDEIRELLGLRASSSEQSCARVRARAEAKLADVDARIRDLTAIRKTLVRLARACPSAGGADMCPILRAIDRSESADG